MLKKANWLIVAGAVTGVYVCALLYQLGLAKVTDFLSPHTNLNEIGDFLAGVLAPIALIWLVAAVFTQRQELNETREQFEENQKVVDAQLKTINSQNALLANQHNQAGESARRTYRLSLFDKRFEIYRELLSIRARMEAKTTIASEWQDLERVAEMSAFVFKSDISDYLERVVEECLNLIHFEHEQHNAWYIDPLSGGSPPMDRESVNVRKNYLAGKLRIEEALSMKSLRELMWSSMRVSDD